jgi:hypothetical protein
MPGSRTINSKRDESSTSYPFPRAHGRWAFPPSGPSLPHSLLNHSALGAGVRIFPAKRYPPVLVDTTFFQTLTLVRIAEHQPKAADGSPNRRMDEGRKSVILTAAAILASRKLVQQDSTRHVRKVLKWYNPAHGKSDWTGKHSSGVESRANKSCDPAPACRRGAFGSRQDRGWKVIHKTATHSVSQRPSKD